MNLDKVNSCKDVLSYNKNISVTNMSNMTVYTDNLNKIYQQWVTQSSTASDEQLDNLYNQFKQALANKPKLLEFIDDSCCKTNQTSLYLKGSCLVQSIYFTLTQKVSPSPYIGKVLSLWNPYTIIGGNNEVYVYQNNVNQKITAPTGVTEFGKSVSIYQGQIVVAGSEVYLIDLINLNQTKIINTDKTITGFGTSVSIFNKFIAVGCNNAVQVFILEENSWNLFDTIIGTDSFGKQVQLNNNYLCITSNKGTHIYNIDHYNYTFKKLILLATGPMSLYNDTLVVTQDKVLFYINLKDQNYVQTKIVMYDTPNYSIDSISLNKILVASSSGDAAVWIFDSNFIQQGFRTTGETNFGQSISTFENTIVVGSPGSVITYTSSNISTNSPVVTTSSPVSTSSPTLTGWTMTGSLNVPRKNAAYCLLDNKKVFVCGGSSNPDIQSSAEVYDPSTGIWTLVNSMNTPKENHSVVLLLTGKVLVIGQKNVELYDSTANSWTTTGSLNTAKTTYDSIMLNDGNVLVADISGSCEVYNYITGKWSVTGPMTAKTRVQLLKINDGIMSVGTEIVEIYKNNVWTSASSLPIGEYVCTLLSNSNVMAASDKVYMYNQTTGNWAYVCDCPYKINTKLIELPNGSVMAAGGKSVNSDNGMKSCYLYNSEVWTSTGSLSIEKYKDIQILLSTGFVLEAGGTYDGYRTLKSSELYDGNSKSIIDDITIDKLENAFLDFLNSDTGPLILGTIISIIVSVLLVVLIVYLVKRFG